MMLGKSDTTGAKESKTERQGTEGGQLWQETASRLSDDVVSMSFLNKVGPNHFYVPHGRHVPEDIPICTSQKTSWLIYLCIYGQVLCEH